MSHTSHRIVRRYPVLTFVVLTYVLTWIGWIPLAVFGLPPTPVFVAIYTITGFGPAVAALIVTWMAGDDVRGWAAQFVHWRVNARYWLVALFLPAVAMVIAGGIALFLTGRALSLPTAHQVTYQSVAYPIMMVLVLLAGGGQEEPGWRGFALPRLQKRYSALVSSLLVGVAWIVWHLPLFAIYWSSQYGVSFVPWALMALALSVVFTWVYNATRGSVLLVAVLHASVNNAAIFFLAGGVTAFETPLGYWLFAGVLVTVSVAIVLRYGSACLSNFSIPRGPPGNDVVEVQSTEPAFDNGCGQSSE